MSDLLPAPSPRIKSLVEQLKRDKDPFELREEIATCRAIYLNLLEQVEDETANVDLIKAAPVINQLLNSTGKLVQRLHEIEVGRRYVIRVDQVQQSMQQILAIIVEHVDDPLTRAEIAERIASLSVTGPSPDIKMIDLPARQQALVDLAREQVSQEGAPVRGLDQISDGSN